MNMIGDLMNQYEALFESGGFGTVLYDEPMKYHTTFKIGGQWMRW